MNRETDRQRDRGREETEGGKRERDREREREREREEKKAHRDTQNTCPSPHPPGRKINKAVDLVPPVAVIGEALEVDDEVVGQGPQVKLLGGLLVLAALRAVPRVLLTQLFCFSEQAQTVVQLHDRSLRGVAVAHGVMLLQVLEMPCRTQSSVKCHIFSRSSTTSFQQQQKQQKRKKSRIFLYLFQDEYINFCHAFKGVPTKLHSENYELTWHFTVVIINVLQLTQLSNIDIYSMY